MTEYQSQFWWLKDGEENPVIAKLEAKGWKVIRKDANNVYMTHLLKREHKERKK